MSRRAASVDVPLLSDHGEEDATAINYGAATALSKKADSPSSVEEAGERTWLKCPRYSSFVAAVAGSISAVISIVVFSIPSAHSACGPSNFLPTTSAIDAAVVDAVRSVLVVTLLFTFRPLGALYVVSFMEILLIGKCFVINWGDKSGHGDKIVVVASVVATVVQQIGAASTALSSTQSGINQLTLSGLWRVTQPYVIPKSMKGRFMAIALWCVLAVSQALKILAPLQLAKIITLLGGNGEEEAGGGSEPAHDVTTTTMMAMTTTTASSSSSSNSTSFPHLSTTQSELVGEILLYAVLMFLPKFFNEIRDLCFVGVWRDGYEDLQTSVFEYVFRLKLDWHLHNSVGTTSKIISDGVQAADELVYALLVHLVPALILAISAFVVFVAHLDQPMLAGLSWVGFNSYIFFTLVLVREKQIERDELSEAIAEVRGRSVEVLIGVEAVKAFAHERKASQWVKEGTQHFIKTYMLVRTSHSVIDLTQSSIVGLTRYAILVIAGIAVLRSNGSDGGWIHSVNPLTVGQFVALKELLERVFEPLEDLAGKIISIVQALLDLKDVVALLENTEAREREEPEDAVDLATLPPAQAVLCKTVTVVERNPATGAMEPPSTRELCIRNPRGLSVEFKNVCFKYPSKGSHRGSQQEQQKHHPYHSAEQKPSLLSESSEDSSDEEHSDGLVGVSFAVSAGGTLGICGSSGSYKSTIAKLLLRMYDVDSGSILVGGYNIAECKNLRRVTAHVPQEASLFDATIAANVEFGYADGVEPDHKEILEVLDRTKLTEVISSMPGQCATRTGQRGGKLSGGERQRIALARALLRRPRILIADESTASLDSVTEAEIEKELTSFATTEGRTGIIIAHRLSQLMTCDEILVLDQGRVVQRGTHSQLMSEQNGLYWRMWSTQNQSFAAKAGSSAAAAAALEVATAAVSDADGARM